MKMFNSAAKHPHCWNHAGSTRTSTRDFDHCSSLLTLNLFTFLCPCGDVVHSSNLKPFRFDSDAMFLTSVSGVTDRVPTCCQNKKRSRLAKTLVRNDPLTPPRGPPQTVNRESGKSCLQARLVLWGGDKGNRSDRLIKT